MMRSVIQNNLRRIFYVVFSLSFFTILFNFFFFDQEYRYSKGFLLAMIIVGLLAIWGIYWLINKYEEKLVRNYKWIVLAFLIIMGILQLVFGFMLRFEPAFDMEAIYGGAIEWVENGNFNAHADYFLNFKNNLGSMCFLYFFFSIAHLFGITDYFAVGIVVNCMMSLTTMLLTSLICKKLLGAKYGLFALGLFMLSPPFYFIAPVFYTDALSMMFPILIYYLYLKTREVRQMKGLLLLSLLMGVFSFIGINNKFTVVIILIAIVIDSLLRNNWKKTLLMTGTVCMVTVLLFGIFNGIMYNKYLDKELENQKRIPHLHWVMMGLEGSGAYNQVDYEFTRSYNTYEEKNQAIKEEIKDRLAKLGIDGLCNLLKVKNSKNFGDGTYSLSDFLDDTPANDVWIQKCILYNGEYYHQYRHLCMGIFFSLLVLMLFSGVKEIFEPKSRTQEETVPRLTIFGIMIFLAMWESNGRYISNYVPIIIISAAFGIKYFNQCMVAAIKSSVALGGIMKERFSKAKIDTFLRQQYMIRGIKIRVVDMAFVAVMIILSFIVRIKLFPIETYDYFYYVDWLRQTKAGGGFFSLANKISDYNSPYMYILCLLSIFPGKEITLLKMVPVIFDYIAGIYVMKIIYKMTRNTHTAILGLMAFLLLPTVVINGAYWGQCDIIYCTFLLGTLYYCMSAEYGKAFVFLGIAFAFKLQGLFLLPFLIILYLCENKIKLRNFLFIPAVYFISEIPAWIMGRNLWELLTIYVGQAESYDWGTSEYPNIYAILAEASPEAHHPLEVGQAGTFCVIMILGFLAYYTYRSKVKFDKDLILLLALFSTAVFTYGLPHMHERYGFILDILVVIYAVVNKKRVLMAAGFEAVSLLAYMPFLFGKRLIPIQYSAVILLFLIVLVGYDYVQLIQKRKAEEAVTVDLEMYD